MSYVAYHKETTRYLRNHPKVKTDMTRFATAAAAKATITREAKRGAILAEDFLVCSSDEFVKIEKTETVTQFGNGTKPTAPFEISVNIPLSCDPRSETYWCM